MSWDQHFIALYERCLNHFQNGDPNWENYYSPDDLEFLASIGCQPRELFDFVEDFANEGVPAPSTALLVAAVRRDFFLTIQKGQPSEAPRLLRNEAPAKADKLEGVRYFPRILAKARAKLRGELDADLMFGCGGDRAFFAEHGDLHPADFLRHVWAAGDNDQQVLDYVRSQSPA